MRISSIPYSKCRYWLIKSHPLASSKQCRITFKLNHVGEGDFRLRGSAGQGNARQNRDGFLHLDLDDTLGAGEAPPLPRRSPAGQGRQSSPDATPRGRADHHFVAIGNLLCIRSTE
jgi:hypothetical protein